jgi:hypothetical protein
MSNASDEKRKARRKQIRAGDYVVPNSQLCEYGCNQLAKFILITAHGKEKFCCALHYQSCPAKGTWSAETRVAYKAKTGYDHPLQKTIQIKETRLKKYGVDHHMKVPEIMAQKKVTCIELYGAPQGFTEEQHQANIYAKYGVGNVFQLPDVIKKLKQTNQEKFGADYPHASEEFRKKFRKQCLDKLGVEHPLCKGTLSEEQHKITMRERHGVEYAGQVETGKIKAKQTCLNHFGAPHHFQSPEWFNSNKAPFKRKPYSLPSGKIIQLQGYELEVLDMLLQTFKESDFEFENKHVFEYKDPETGKSRRYHPDFMLPSQHIIFEVKSLYYFELDYPVLLRKAKACVDLGWEFIVIMRDSRDTEFSFIPFRFLQQEKYEKQRQAIRNGD